jgi:hypothetical protein
MGYFASVNLARTDVLLAIWIYLAPCLLEHAGNATSVSGEWFGRNTTSGLVSVDTSCRMHL